MSESILFNSSVQLNEKIKRFEQHLVAKPHQELQQITSAVQQCQDCQDKQDWYLCLSQQNLTYRQIAILEGISPHQLREHFPKSKTAQKVCPLAI